MPDATFGVGVVADDAHAGMDGRISLRRHGGGCGRQSGIH